MLSNERWTLALTGDSMITRRLGLPGDEPLNQLSALIHEADVAFTNLEVLPNDFRGHPMQESGGTHLAAHRWVLDELWGMGFGLLATATNHALDYGIEGLLATIENLEQHEFDFAGLGRNLAEARMPAYHGTQAGTVALISCCSSFSKGQQAAEQRPDMQGRPGLNPLRFETTYEVTADQIEQLRRMSTDLGLEAQRLDHIKLGFAYPPSDPDVFPFLDMTFRIAEKTAVRMQAKQQDIDAIAAWTREARDRADLVIVSLHAHEQGATKEDPAEFIPVFARRMIDEGADVVVGHGPHLLRGMEMHAGKPIFYSLGNFIAQNDLVYKLPADSYERFRVDPTSTPGEIARTRSQGGTKGFPSDARYWQTVMPTLRYDDFQLREIELVPISLRHGQAVHRRGRPGLAGGQEARDILERFAKLSKPFGTTIESDGERGRVVL